MTKHLDAKGIYSYTLFMESNAATTHENPAATNAGHNADRLAHAKNFADKLNESRLWKTKISYQKRWTMHRRAQKSVEIQITKPWRHATSPKTMAGKNRSRLNAVRKNPATCAMNHALSLNGRFLRTMNLLIRLRECRHTDANILNAHCARLGIYATRALMAALLLHRNDFPPVDKISCVTS